MNKKGQNLRLALRGENDQAKKYIAGALSFDLQIDSDTEENTTKDSTGAWKQFEPTLKSWSGSGQCRLAKDATDTAAVQGWDIADLVGVKLEASFDETNGEQNRSLVTARKKGDVIITSWKISAQSGNTVNADFSFQGTGALQNAGTAVTISGSDTLTATTTAATSSYTASDSTTIIAKVDSADESWLAATILDGTLSYKSKSAASATRVGHIYLTTASGAFKRVEVVEVVD